jgi:hypothetical protein
MFEEKPSKNPYFSSFFFVYIKLVMEIIYINKIYVIT